ncbi:hypothetical protein D3C81_1108610 [compost metagenome]
MDIGHRQRRQFVRTQHAIDQVAQAVSLFNDHIGVILEAFLGQFPGQQLGRAANTAQWVLDFVGQATHQQLGGFLFGQLGLFLGDAQQAVAWVHFEQ